MRRVRTGVGAVARIVALLGSLWGGLLPGVGYAGPVGVLAIGGEGLGRAVVVATAQRHKAQPQRRVASSPRKAADRQRTMREAQARKAARAQAPARKAQRARAVAAARRLPVPSARARPVAPANPSPFAPLAASAGAAAAAAWAAPRGSDAVSADSAPAPVDEATRFEADPIVPLRLHSSAVLVVDRDTNAVLLGKNDAAVLPIASLTKLMTGLVIVDAGLPMDEVLTITEADIDRLKGSGSRLAVGTRLTRAEALHLALMSSENRAAHALGRTYPGGLPAFVAAMNRKAVELGMTQTRFVEPTGLSSDNRSSPRDLARLTAAAAERPLLRELSTSPEYELQAGKRVVHFRNSNRLVRESDWNILLQKTGYIREAGRCVVMQVRLAGRDLIMVLMDAANSTARWADAERLLRWLDHTLVSGDSAQPRLSL